MIDKNIEELKHLSDILSKSNDLLREKNNDMKNLIHRLFISKEPKKVTPEMYANGYKKDKYNRKILSK